MLTYSSIFALATLSFSLPATAEYMKQVKQCESALREGPPSPEQARSAIFNRLPQNGRPRYSSELEVIKESVIEENGRLFRMMTAQSRQGSRYLVKVDAEGTVHHFEKSES